MPTTRGSGSRPRRLDPGIWTRFRVSAAPLLRAEFLPVSAENTSGVPDADPGSMIGLRPSATAGRMSQDPPDGLASLKGGYTMRGGRAPPALPARPQRALRARTTTQQSPSVGPQRSASTTSSLPRPVTTPEMKLSVDVAHQPWRDLGEVVEGTVAQPHRGALDRRLVAHRGQGLLDIKQSALGGRPARRRVGLAESVPFFVGDRERDLPGRKLSSSHGWSSTPQPSPGSGRRCRSGGAARTRRSGCG